MEVVNGLEKLVMVSNRLPVDRITTETGETQWQTAPGGLVTAVEPIVRQLGCQWVGWPGEADTELEAFDLGSMRLIPVNLTTKEVEEYYGGFSNGTLWPLYHDVITEPHYHREWWDQYQHVNSIFAQRVAQTADPGAIVWVHDYQLQLVPGLLRELRPDLTIAFFLHIPFPSLSLFGQLPWRRQIVEGMLGADVIGFQRVQDAENFRKAAESYAHAPAHGNLIWLPEHHTDEQRSVLAQEFPISIATNEFAALADRPDVQQRAAEIRKELGDPKKILLGVDRLDYTKGIRHRLKAFNELLAEEEVNPDEIVLVQVASPSREQVEAYQVLRDEVEATVGRINGVYGTLGHTPVVYLHRGHNREEMAALYLAADVAVVTSLRDGMNLVAKEYVACREDEQGVLVLSEFTGAIDELPEAIPVNPHDIDGMKAAFLRAIHMPEAEQRRRMKAMRETVAENDVAHWVGNYLGSVTAIAAEKTNTADVSGTGTEADQQSTGPVILGSDLEARLRRLATSPHLIVATDFDGTVAPIVDVPSKARILPQAQEALDVLQEAQDVQVVMLSGRSFRDLDATGVTTSDYIVAGSHGAELRGVELPPEGAENAPGAKLNKDEQRRLQRLQRRLWRVFSSEPNVRLEYKPYGIAVHTRQVADPHRAEEILDAAAALGAGWGVQTREGKMVREFSVRSADKGSALKYIREQLPPGPVLFIGDDVTDEDVFAALESDDLGIKVGEGPTAATELIPDPQTAAAALAFLAQLRTGITIGSEPA